MFMTVGDICQGRVKKLESTPQNKAWIQDGKEASGMNSSTTVDDVLEFVLTAVDYVLQDESDAVVSAKGSTLQKRNTQKYKSDNSLLNLYRRIHGNSDWNTTARSVMDMGNVFFDGRLDHIDKFHDTLYVMEKLIHNGDDTEVNKY